MKHDTTDIDPFALDSLPSGELASALVNACRRELADTPSVQSISIGSSSGDMLVVVALTKARVMEIETMLPGLDGVTGDPVLQVIRDELADTRDGMVNLTYFAIKLLNSSRIRSIRANAVVHGHWPVVVLCDAALGGPNPVVDHAYDLAWSEVAAGLDAKDAKAELLALMVRSHARAPGATDACVQS